MKRITLCLVLALLCLDVAVAQNLQAGTKTAPAMVVAYVAGQSPLPAARDDVGKAFMSLWTACHAQGLHPLGLPILALDATGIDAGTLNWEARLPLADTLDPNALPDKPELHVKLIPETKVAYHFAAGDPWQAMEAAFGDLHQWAVNQNLPVTSQVRAVVYIGPFGNEAENIVTECQIELRQ